MGFIVTANSGRPGEGLLRVEKLTRKAAVGLVGQGMEGVTIADEEGRMFETPEFVAFFSSRLLKATLFRLNFSPFF